MADEARSFCFSRLPVSLVFSPRWLLSFRAGQAGGPLYHGSEGSDQNSQQREAVWVSLDEGTVWCYWGCLCTLTITMLILSMATTVFCCIQAAPYLLYLTSYVERINALTSALLLQILTLTSSCALLQHLHLFLLLLYIRLLSLIRLRGRLPFWNWLSIRMCWSCMMFTRITNICEFPLHSKEPPNWAHCSLYPVFSCWIVSEMGINITFKNYIGLILTFHAFHTITPKGVLIYLEENTWNSCLSR